MAVAWCQCNEHQVIEESFVGAHNNICDGSYDCMQVRYLVVTSIVAQIFHLVLAAYLYLPDISGRLGSETMSHCSASIYTLMFIMQV